jgi:hypothetical protein
LRPDGRANLFAMISSVARPAQRDQVQPGVLGEQVFVTGRAMMDLRRRGVAQDAEPAMKLVCLPSDDLPPGRLTVEAVVAPGEPAGASEQAQDDGPG